MILIGNEMFARAFIAITVLYILGTKVVWEHIWMPTVVGLMFIVWIATPLIEKLSKEQEKKK